MAHAYQAVDFDITHLAAYNFDELKRFKVSIGAVALGPGQRNSKDALRRLLQRWWEDIEEPRRAAAAPGPNPNIAGEARQAGANGVHGDAAAAAAAALAADAAARAHRQHQAAADAVAAAAAVAADAAARARREHQVPGNQGLQFRVDPMFEDNIEDVPIGLHDLIWRASFADIGQHLVTAVPIVKSLQHLLETNTTYLRPGDFILLYAATKIFIYFYTAPATATLRTPGFGIAPPRSQLPANMGVYVLMPEALRYFKDLALSHANFYFDDRSSLKRTAEEALDGLHQNLSSTLVAALSSSAADKTSRSQTPAARSLHRNTASSLSSEPEQVMTTGIFNTYQRILHPTYLGMQPHEWYLAGPLLCQLQPGHILELVSNWSALPLDLFASLDDQFGTVVAKEKTDVFARITSVEVDKSIVIDRSIIGTEINRFGKALMNYGYVLDTIFLFRPVIRQSLIAVFQRLVAVLRPRAYGSTDPRSKALLDYAGRHVMTELQRVYGSTFASSAAITAEATIVHSLNEIPDMTNNSEFSIALGHINSKTATIGTKTTKVEEGHETADTSKRALKRQKQKAAAKKTAEGIPQPAAAGVTKGKGVCGYFLSDVGCKKADCTRLHRQPKPEEQANVLHFFSKNTKLTQVKF